MSRSLAMIRLAFLISACGCAAVASAAEPEEKKDDSAQLKTYSVGGSKTTPKNETAVTTVEKPKFDSGMTFEKPVVVMDMTPFTVTPVTASPAAPQPASKGASKSAAPVPTKPTASTTTGGGALPAAPTPTKAPAATGALPQTPTAAAPTPTLSLVPLSTPAPDYPREAALNQTQGYVVVEFTINSEGSTQDINVVEASPQRVFDQAARRAVSRWKFEPLLENGRPIEKRVQRRIDFKL